MGLNYYLNIAQYGEITLFLNAKYNIETKLESSLIKNQLLAISSKTKIEKVFKMLGIDQVVLEKNDDNITFLEEKLLMISKQLLVGKELTLNYLEKGLNEKERIYLKRIIKKLAHDYNLKVIIFTNDLEFLLDLIDKVIIIEGNNIKSTISNKDIYNQIIYQYIDMPDIIAFVKKCQNLGKRLDNYIDVSEVLKGLYRL